MNNFAIIFDMDGVISDTGDFHEQAWFAYCDKYNISISSKQFREKLFGRSNKETAKILLNREITDKELTSHVDEKEALYRKLAKGKLSPTPGLINFLEEATKAGVTMSLASSAPRTNIDFTLHETDTLAYFSHITSAEEVSRSKPDPSIFLLAAQKMGFAPEQCLVFEDSFAGIEAAQNANMKLITVASTHTKKELPKEVKCISDFSEISLPEIEKMFQ